MPFIVNFFGEGLRLWTCQMKTEEFNCFKKFKEENDLNWESIFFDLEILNSLGYESWVDFSVHESFGLVINSRNTIEVKQRAKRMLKIRSNEILNQTILFDLYQTSVSKSTIETKEGYIGFYLASTEVGTIAKYKINYDSIDFNKLNFRIQENSKLNCKFIYGISYESVMLKRILEDSISRDFRAIV